MKETEFVIIVPAYNAEKHLKRCIASVLAQDYPRVRLVIVNDGSTDKTGEIAGGYASENKSITVIHQENMGQIMARSNGISRALADSADDAYFLFVDADDELKPGALRRIDQLLGQSHCDMLIFGAENYDETASKIIGTLSGSAEGTVDSKAALYKIVLYDTGYNPLWRKAIAKRVIKATDYRAYSHLRYGEDLIQSLDYYKNAGRVFFTREVFYRYHLNYESITHKVDFYHYPVDSDVRRITWEFVTEQNVWTDGELTAYAQFLLDLLDKKLVSLCCFNVPFSEKAKKLDEVKQDEFYAMLLNKELFHGRIIRLLLKRRYRSMIAAAKLKKLTAHFS